MWMGADIEEYLQTSSVESIFRHAERAGIAAWPLLSQEPTSAHTHIGMFAHFGTKASSYYFQHMVRSTHLVLYNTNHVHVDIMRPWVECALAPKCISPLGAESGGCIQRKPRYLYSGCHRYAESALNVVLGLAFNYDDTEYTLQNYSEIFGTERTTPSGNNFTIVESTAANINFSFISTSTAFLRSLR